MSQQTTSRSSLSDLLSPEFLARLDALDIVSRKILQGKIQGERRSRRRGQSVEFADHKPYTSGDDLRFVDWNIYARLEQLFLRLFLEEQDLTVNILLDVSASQAEGSPTKEKAAKQLAAALAYVALANNCRLGLCGFADGLTGQFSGLRGRAYLPRLAEFLLARPAEGPSDFEKACRQLQSARIGSGVTIVISDFLFKSGYEQGLRRLVSPAHDLYVIQLLSPQELEPDLAGDLKLVDVEDGDTSEVTISAALMKYYKKAVASYCGELKEFCTRRGAAYALANSGQSMEWLVLSYLRKSGLLR